MKNMREYGKEAVSTLLATTKMDASRFAEKANATKIPPDTHNRTILIGVGGTGIKTIDRVKGVIKDRLDDTWASYISFLGIDSDMHEVDNCSYLKAGECVITTRPNVEQRAANEAMYPKAWRPFADPNAVKLLQNLSGNGSGRKRLAGKLKIHDKAAGSSGVDSDIVRRLTEIRGNMILTGNQKYEVYVIGSLIGGTCSGGFLELPVLVQRALNSPGKVHVNAILYMPDTMSGAHPEIKDELEANGYASLKELNYYEGMSMREGYSEYWTDNDAVDGKVSLAAGSDFFTMPYLIGSVSGAADNSEERARETISEYFISILGSVETVGAQPFMVDQFVNNALQYVGIKDSSPANLYEEAPGCSHEFPKRFASIGFSKAAAPQEVVYAYAVSKACVSAGLVPVNAAEHAARKLANAPVLPFLASGENMTASEGIDRAYELIAPLVAALNQLEKKTYFSYEEKFPNAPANWDNIRGNKVGHHTDLPVTQFVTEQTTPAALKKLDEILAKALMDIQVNVKSYVNEFGPMSFVNLCKGNFDPETGKTNVGVLEMIERIRDRLEPRTGAAKKFVTAVDAQLSFNDADTQVRNVDAGGLIGSIGNLFVGNRNENASDWKTKFDEYVDAQIKDKYWEHLYGSMKRIDKNVLDPMRILCDDIRAFGDIITALSAAYQSHGEKLTDFKKFASISDGETEVNIAAVNGHAHQWLVDEAKKIAREIDGEKVRKAVINSFFENRTAWLEFPEQLIEVMPTGKVKLQDPDRAVPARMMFDAVMNENIQMNIDVSIKTLFTAMDGQSVPYSTFATQIVGRLQEQSKPLFNGTLDDKAFLRYIMYPASLNVDEGSKGIVTAIQEAARTAFPDANIGFYGSGYADGIMMYQFAAPFEVYRLHDLPQWEESYRKMIAGAKAASGLHGRAPHPKEEVRPDGTTLYSERNDFSWYDYPEIIRTDADPTKKDPKTGLISREGLQRIELQKIIDEAREIGVLYSKQEPDGWYIYRVYCDLSTNWKFDSDWMAGNEELGIPFIRTIAKRNKCPLDDISSRVVLKNGGLLSDAADTEERAWKRAARVLRAHVPMYHEVRETLDLVRPWAQEILEIIGNDMKKWVPAKMIRLMQAGVLLKTDADIWMIKDSDGSKTTVCKMDENAISRLANRDPRFSAIVENGMTLFYIFEKFCGVFESDAELDTELGKLLSYAKERRDDEYEEEAVDETTDLTNSLLKVELAKVQELGVDLKSPDRQKKSVYDRFQMLDIEQEDVDEIARFYSFAQLWKKLK